MCFLLPPVRVFLIMRFLLFGGKAMYTIRAMTREEVAEIAVEWAAREGWNPGLHDASCFYATDPTGFLVGLLDGEPIACISAVAYDATFGFIGFYIVKPEYRGKGYGFTLWQAAMEYLGTQNIGLDGVIAQQENYKKSGFQLAYRNIRYEGRSKRSTEQPPHIVPLATIAMDELQRYDTTLFPVARQRFTECWVQLPESHAYAAIANGQLAGYTVVRACRNGYKIGPLFADTPELAEQLFVAANNAIEPNSLLYLDIPERNSAAVALAERHNMSTVFETARMYTKNEPTIDLGKVFGVTTFELG